MNDQYGQLTDIVKATGFIISAALAITLTWRGRANWEPSEQDIPKGPQKVGGLISAISLAILWVYFDKYESINTLTSICIALAISTLIGLLFYSFIISTQTYEIITSDGKNKIIGGFRLTQPAYKATKEGSDSVTTQRYLAKQEYDPDAVWTRSSRALAKLSFILGYLCLTVSGTLSLSAVGIIFILKNQPKGLIEVHDKKIIHIGIVLNSTIFYTRQIMSSFTTDVNNLLKPTPYSAHFDWEIGIPETPKIDSNSAVFRKLFNKFPNKKPDYLVTIGTTVSQYAYRHYLNKLPVIFIGVTDPIRSGIVKNYDPDPKRGNIGGVIYGLPIDKYLDFFVNAFPGKRFGFVWNAEYDQDKHLLDEILLVARRRKPVVNIVPIQVSSPTLDETQKSKADIFFGRYYVAANLEDFINNTNMPFVAGDISNVYKGALACIAPESSLLGSMAAQNVLLLSLMEGTALSDIPITGPKNGITAVNLQAARRYGITLSKESIKNAFERVE